MRSTLLALALAGAGSAKGVRDQVSSSVSSSCVCYATTSSTTTNYVSTVTPTVTQTAITTVAGFTKVVKVTSFVEDDYTQTLTKHTTVTTTAPAVSSPAVQARDVSVAEDNKKQCICPTTSTTTRIKTVKGTLTATDTTNIITKWSKVTNSPITITSTIYRNTSEAVATKTVYSTVSVTKTSKLKSSSSSSIASSVNGSTSGASFTSSTATISSSGSSISSTYSTSAAPATTSTLASTSTMPVVPSFTDCTTTPSSFYIQMEGTDQYVYLSGSYAYLGNNTEAAAFSLDSKASSLTTPDYGYDYYSYPGEAQGETLYSVYASNGDGGDWEGLMFAPQEQAEKYYNAAAFAVNADCTITYQVSAWVLQSEDDDGQVGLFDCSVDGICGTGIVPTVTFLAVSS